MNDRARRHPKVETMAAFVEGTLAPNELTEIAEHLRDCSECRTVVGETARFEAEEAAAQRGPERATSHGRRTRLWAAAAAAAGVIALSVPLIQRTAAFAPVSVLIDASPRDYRRVEGRLSGFPWARHSPVRGASTSSPEDLDLAGAAGKVLRRTADDDDAKARHAAGVAHLLIDEPARGVEELERAARSKSDARYWNDLAVAHLSVREERPSHLPLALAAADRALRIDPTFLEAHFNRALILEAQGTKDAARRQWRRYLELDPSSEWATEAREHLRRLEPKPEPEVPKDLSGVPAFVRESPQEARRQAENFQLYDWADAHADGEHGIAEERLRYARAIGEALAATNGDAFVLDVIHAIDRADAHSRDALAAAHLRFYEGRRANNDREIAVAEARFREAEAMFRAARSPMAQQAAYFVAQAAASLNRGPEAIDALTRLRARIDRARYPSLVADIDWQLGLSSVRAADFAATTRWGTSAAEAFAKLGESRKAAFSDGIAAHALERIGSSDLAWSRYVRALEGLDGDERIAAEQRRRLEHSAALALAATDRLEAAESMLDVLFNDGIEKEGDVFQAETLTDRARLAQRSGDLTVARRSLSQARAVVDRIGDPETRATATARVRLAEAALKTADDPRGAVALLDDAVTFFERRGEGLRLPDAYLQRARARRAAGDETGAIADYHAALAEIARQKELAGNVQIAFLDTAGEIIDDLVALHLARRDVANAFVIADRAHAMLASSAVPVVARGMALLEYAVLPRKIVIFCVTADGIAASAISVDRPTLGEKAASLAHKIRSRASEESIRTDAAALHALLIAPVARHLNGVEEIVIVTDRQLHALPFAVLYDASRGRHLVEDYVIRFAPSAQGRSISSSAMKPAVVFADPDTKLARLQYSRDEAETVAGMHAATLVTGKDATRERFIDAVQRNAMVHYAGHADSDLESYGALLLAESNGDHGILGASDIERLDLRTHAPLVVLSACGTARGTASHVAGMPSLARAFLHAGARAVVGTLWEVQDDLAARLFLRFHDHLRTGAAPARALHAAQNGMLQSSDPRLRHPSTWSAVEVLSNL